MKTPRIPKRLVTGNFGKMKITLAPFIYYDHWHGCIEVPAGFIFDGASIPRFAWSTLGVTPYDPKVVAAAVVHDWLYNSKVKSKKDADAIFYYIMEYQGLLSTSQMRLMYTAVKLFGGKAYKKLLNDNEFLCPDEVINYIKSEVNYKHC